MRERKIFEIKRKLIICFCIIRVTSLELNFSEILNTFEKWQKVFVHI